MPNERKKILVIDVGGSNIKMMISQEEKRRKFPSGPKIGPEEAVEQIKETTSDWSFDAVAIGFPAPVREGKIMTFLQCLRKGVTKPEKSDRRDRNSMPDSGSRAPRASKVLPK